MQYVATDARHRGKYKDTDGIINVLPRTTPLYFAAKQMCELVDWTNAALVGQRRVWDYLLTVDEAAPREVSAAATVPLPTVAQALAKLLGLGQAQRLGQGRATRYRLAELEGKRRRAA